MKACGLSVLICVYNTPITLIARCLDKIQASSAENRLEVVLVDDGSTLDYLDVVKNYPVVRYFKIPHQGTLHARSFAVSKASYAYSAFVDADDCVSSSYLEGGLNAIGSGADIVVNDWAEENGNYRAICSRDSTISKRISAENEGTLSLFFDQKGREHAYYVLWNKVFKTELLRRAIEKIAGYGLSTLVYGEDVLICYFAFRFATRITNTHVGFYFYNHHSAQQTAYSDDEQKLLFHVQNLSTVFRLIEEDLRDSGLWKKYGKCAYEWKRLISASQGAETRDKDTKRAIADAYGLRAVRKPRFADGKAYLFKRLLPSNFEEIDKWLKEVRFAEGALKLYAKKGSYAKWQLENTIEAFQLPHKLVKSKKEAQFAFPREEYSFKNKIVTNKAVCLAGLLFFPKGSKLRRWLKDKVYKGSGK